MLWWWPAVTSIMMKPGMHLPRLNEREGRVKARRVRWKMTWISNSVHLFEAGKLFTVKNGRLDSPRTKDSVVLAHGRCKEYWGSTRHTRCPCPPLLHPSLGWNKPEGRKYIYLVQPCTYTRHASEIRTLQHAVEGKGKEGKVHNISFFILLSKW